MSLSSVCDHRQDARRRKQFRDHTGNRITLEAVLNTTCSKCGCKGTTTKWKKRQSCLEGTRLNVSCNFLLEISLKSPLNSLFQVTLQRTVSLLRACNMLFCLKRTMRSHSNRSSRPPQLRHSKTQTKRRRKRRWICDNWCPAWRSLLVFSSCPLPFFLCLSVVNHLMQQPTRLCMTMLLWSLTERYNNALWKLSKVLSEGGWFCSTWCKTVVSWLGSLVIETAVCFLHCHYSSSLYCNTKQNSPLVRSSSRRRKWRRKGRGRERSRTATATAAEIASANPREGAPLTERTKRRRSTRSTNHTNTAERAARSPVTHTLRLSGGCKRGRG